MAFISEMGLSFLAGAVVTKDILPYVIVGGVTAKIFKWRYDKEDIKLLLTTRWWDKDLKWIKEYKSLFLSIDTYRSKFYEPQNISYNCQL